MPTYKIPVSKAKGEFLEIDTDHISDEMLREATYQGLKQMLGRNMSKVTKTEYPDAKELTVKAVEVATANAKAILDNDQKRIKLTSAPKAAKVSGKVNTEAMRLARNLIKDAMRAEGLKPSHYEASEITKAAKEVLADDEQGPALIAQAEENLKKREENKPKGIDIKALVKESPKLVAKAEEKKAKAKAEKGLSATQAGIPAARAGKPPKQKPAQATLQ